MLKALAFHKSTKYDVRSHIIFKTLFMCACMRVIHNPRNLYIWPYHHTVPFCHSCYGDGGWILRCSAMATVSRVTRECQRMKSNQYTVLSKVAVMRCIGGMTEGCSDGTDTGRSIESMFPSSSQRVHFIFICDTEINQSGSQRHEKCSFVLFVSLHHPRLAWPKQFKSY